MPHNMLESVQITEGSATLIFSESVTDPSFVLSLINGTAHPPLEVTSSLAEDGKSLLLASSSIHATSALSFVGNVSSAGTPIAFDFIKATSLVGARTAVANAKMAFSVTQGDDLTIEGTHAAFGAEADILTLQNASNYDVPHPTIDLGAGDDRVVAGSGTVLSSHSTTGVNAGSGHDALEFNTQSFNLLFGIRGSLSLDSYNFSNFEEVVLPYGTLLNKPVFGTSLTLNLGTKNAIDTLTFGAKAGSNYNQSGDMAVLSGTAKNVVINGMAENTTVNFNGGVDVDTTAFTMKGVKNLDVNFATDNAVDMAFGKLTLSNTENLHITVTDNAVSNSISVNDLNVTNLSSLTLTDLDADDSATIILNGTLAANSLLNFSEFGGSVILKDNAGAATVSLASTHGNVITLKSDNAANTIMYAAAGNGGDTVANFEVTHDKLQFSTLFADTVRSATTSDGNTSVYLDENGNGQFDNNDAVLVTLAGTAGFSAENIVFA